MNISREKKKAEAIKRLRQIRYYNLSIKEFRQYDRIMVNEPPMGAHYYPEPELQKEIDAFEKEHNALVYMVVRSFTDIGDMDSLVFVSDYPEEWEDEMIDLADGYALAYVINRAWPEFSEMGSITFRKTPAGGVLRVF